MIFALIFQAVAMVTRSAVMVPTRKVATLTWVFLWTLVLQPIAQVQSRMHAHQHNLRIPFCPRFALTQVARSSSTTLTLALSSAHWSSNPMLIGNVGMANTSTRLVCAMAMTIVAITLMKLVALVLLT